MHGSSQRGTLAGSPPIRSTTILSVRVRGQVAIGGDGQVTVGDSVIKGDARKIRRLGDGEVLCGFAGSAADALTLLERFEGVLKKLNGQTLRAAVELAKLWRTDRMLRRLESMLLVCDRRVSLLIGGSGDVIEPKDGILAIGSGGGYARAAATALARHTALGAADIVREGLRIAAGICIYTNDSITVDELDAALPPSGGEGESSSSEAP